MNKLKDKILFNNVPYICILDDKSIGKEGYDYQVLTYFYDEDFELPSFIGAAKDKKCSFEEFKKECINSKIKKLKELRNKITQDEYFIHNDEIVPTYFALEENVKKYKRKRAGNPDVDKLIAYQKQHPEVLSFDTHYDIKYYSQMVDIFPKEVINNIVMTTKCISREENATIDRRREVNNYIMDIKMDSFNISKDLQYGFFNRIETDFKYMKNKLTEYLNQHHKIYLFYLSFDKKDKKLIKRLNLPIKKVSFQDFTIDAFINFKSNILYSFSKE